MNTVASNAPGFSPVQVFESMNDHDASRLLPQGAYSLINAIQPESLSDSRRNKTLGSLLSVELAIDDPNRRSDLLSALPTAKVKELETRVGATVDELCSSHNLSSKQRRRILGFFGIATVPEHPINAPASDIEIQPSRALFPHQKRAAAAVERYLYFENHRVMLHLPTGVGKTRTAMSIIASHLRSQERALVVWLANTRELLEQAAIEFEATWAAVGDRSVACHRFWSNHEAPIADVVDGIILAGLAKLHSYGRTRESLWALGDRTTLVVFDEAHQAVATTYEDLVQTLVTRNPRTGLLGLSATPGRTWSNPTVDEAVANLFYGNKVTIDFGEENPIARLTRDGYLATVSFSPLNVEPGLKLSPEDLAKLTDALDIPEYIAEALGDDEQRNLRIIQCLLELAKSHDRILVFAASVANSRLLASVCRAVGLHADVVTGGTDKLQRRQVIERFKSSDARKRILINYGVLTTGFDAPAASAVLIARPTRSLVLYSQMVGRVIRGPRAGGTESCEVITVVDTSLPGFRDVAEAFTNWEDIWTP